MQTPPLIPQRRAVASLAFLLAFAGSLPAQETTTPASASTRKEAAVVLSPFEVRTDKDTSYGALNSNTVTLFNVDLLKTPVAADIFTQQFMDDVGVTSVEDLLNGYGAGAGAVLATPDSDSNNNQPGDRFSVAQMGSRGLSAGDVRRDGFIASSTQTSGHDTFDVERVEQVKGSNAVMYGSSGVGGYTNTISKRAKFGSNRNPDRSGSISSRIDQYGTHRWLYDFNLGLDKIAVRFSVLDEIRAYRRLFLGARTNGYYGTISLKLPLNSVLRVTGRRTDNDRVISTRVDNLSFTSGTQRDARQNYSLLYMLATNQAGAINPATGQPWQGTAIDPATGTNYQLGAIVNGLLSYDNASSWSGWSQSEDITSDTYTGVLETVWAPWLSTQVGAMADYSIDQRGPDGGTLHAPNHFDTANPFNDWANSSTFRMDRNASRRYAYRASALITNDLFGNRAHSQTVFGYDADFSATGNTNYRYYEADANFNVYDLNNPRPAGIGPTVGGTTAANALGRWELGNVYWPVGGGPLAKPGWRIGSRQITVAGRNYVLLQQNPRNPGYVTATNPLGLASLSGVSGFNSLSGSNLGNYAQKDDSWGLYGANYSRWFDDRLTFLIGYRLSHSWDRNPNTSLSGTTDYDYTTKDNRSWNFGGEYKLSPWLYSYVSIGQTFLPAKGSRDPYGVEPKDTEGMSHEVGLKYSLLDGRISGSVAYYWASQNNDNFNYGSATLNLINPVGINDAYNPAYRNNWVSLDKESSGFELIVTAAPTKNWRARLGFTQQDGKIKTSSSYNLLWNDEFYYDKATGGVTYANGAPFIVPTDAAGVTAVSKISAPANPVAGATSAQLTLAMLNDPNSDYYAYGKGAASVPINGALTSNSVVWRALRYFQTKDAAGNLQQARTLRTGLPLSAIPYAYSDPAGYKGVYQVSQQGEPVVGNPLYRLVLTNSYDFTQWVLKGISVGATVRWDIDKRTYWYREPMPGSNVFQRKLYKEASINPQVDTFIRYRHRFRYVTFSTQVNIYNMFNKYKVDLRPDVSTGFSNPANIGATFVGEPRLYAWTNTISF